MSLAYLYAQIVIVSVICARTIPSPDLPSQRIAISIQDPIYDSGTPLEWTPLELANLSF